MHASTTSNLIEVVISPPALYLLPLADAIKGSNIKIAAQNCNFKDSAEVRYARTIIVYDTMRMY